MKKLFLIVVLGVFSLFATAQDYTFVAGSAPTLIYNDTLASAATASVVCLLKSAPDGKPLRYSLVVQSLNVSGTSEGYIDLYGANYNTALAYELLSARTSNDTLNSSNLVDARTDTDGYDYRYLRFNITNKTQTQSTIYKAWLYVTKQ